MIDVMIVDDHDIVREGLKMILSLSSDINITAEASNGREAMDLLQKQPVDVVLLDIRMPVMNGVATTKAIKKSYPEIKVIILTTFNEDEYIFEALKNGADGYVLKDVKPDEIIKGIKSVHAGNVMLHPEVAAKVVREFNTKREDTAQRHEIAKKDDKLTVREAEVAGLIAQGRSNREIGELLYITEGTVRNHISNILDKLGLRDRTQVALYVNGKSEIS